MPSLQLFFGYKNSSYSKNFILLKNSRVINFIFVITSKEVVPSILELSLCNCTLKQKKNYKKSNNYKKGCKIK